MHTQPSFLRVDGLKQRAASSVDLVSAPHVQHLITKKDTDELAQHGFLIAESLDACALACTHAAAVSLAVHTMKDISVLYKPAEVQGFPDVVRALLNHFAQLHEAAPLVDAAGRGACAAIVQAALQHGGHRGAKARRPFA